MGKIVALLLLSLAVVGRGDAEEILPLEVISYEDFIAKEAGALAIMETALYEKGIVGIKGIPGYREKVERFIECVRQFSALPEEIKEQYAPDRARGDLFLGYEKGKEKFRRPDGRWFIDDLKVSYYGFVPDVAMNKWPVEMDLKTPFLELGTVMGEMGKAMMQQLGLIGEKTGLFLNETPALGRMLHYVKCGEATNDNPFWCGAHFDHSLFTVLIPAFYYDGDVEVQEPEEAGLFVKTDSDGVFRKIAAADHDVLLFQVGEFGQLVANDAIRATEHRVHKALGSIERYAMAVFCLAPMEAVIHSTSELAKDVRYGEGGTWYALFLPPVDRGDF